jgi:hypothetical protein
MQGWQPDAAPGCGWPLGERTWINPSPNAPNLSMARAYAGTVMLEGTTLSEGRGTTRPLELFGAPDIDANHIIKRMFELAPQWLQGCRLRACWFEPTFHKHVGKLCSGVQIHVEDDSYRHELFRPWRVQALAFKAIRQLYPDYPLWRDFPYEYVLDKLAIDVINGRPLLREWVDDVGSTPAMLESTVSVDEHAWSDAREPVPLYRHNKVLQHIVWNTLSLAGSSGGSRRLGLCGSDVRPELRVLPLTIDCGRPARLRCKCWRGDCSIPVTRGRILAPAGCLDHRRPRTSWDTSSASWAAVLPPDRAG